MVVCHCAVINDAVLREHIAAGGVTVEEVASRCSAGARCGGCRPMIEQLIREAVPSRRDLVGMVAAVPVSVSAHAG